MLKCAQKNYLFCIPTNFLPQLFFTQIYLWHFATLSSPFFQNLLSRNKDTHPLIYMRGVKSEDLLAIIDFLYCGEANVYQEHLDSFLSIAEEFQLKGRMEKSKNKKDTVPTPIHPSIHPPVQMNMEIKGPNCDGNKSFVPPQFKYENQFVSERLQELNEKSHSMMEKTMKTHTNGRTLHKCKVCGKEDYKTQNLKNHIVRNHLEGVSIPCNICKETFRSAGSLANHNSRHHRETGNEIWWKTLNFNKYNFKSC